MADADLVCTATAFTAVSIAEAYRRFIFPQLEPAELARLQVILGGGGAKNRTLRTMLSGLLPGAEVLVHEDFGIRSQAKEALAFAILAYQTLHGRPSNVPSATGARHPAILGTITPAG